VPGLRINSTEGSGIASISIRGVRQQIGAATTGFYLDDVSLQKRSSPVFAGQNGTPIPPLFDLERVEVLRGPQGTLFGGGSEGGTIRFIQPQPSLTEASAYARVEASFIDEGDASYEAGIAYGAPIIEGKLGFRGSFFHRSSGGYIDLTDYRDGEVYSANANSGEVEMARLAFKLEPNDWSRFTLSGFNSRDETDHNSTSFNLPIEGTVTAPPVCYNVAALRSLPPGSTPRLVPGLVPGFAMAGAACAAVANNPAFYTAPGFTLGPLALQDYQSLVLGPSPTSTEVKVASLNSEFDLPHGLTLTSVTSYVHDVNTANSPQNFHSGLISYRQGGMGGVVYQVPGQDPIVFSSGLGLNPNVTASANDHMTGGRGLGAYILTNSRNQRYGFSQEFRVASEPNGGPFNFVAGAYYSNFRTRIEQQAKVNAAAFPQLTGLTLLERYSTPDPGYFSWIREFDKDIEAAVFGDVTWRINDLFSATAGVRFSHVETQFYQTNTGPNGLTLTASEATGTLVTGTVEEDPITPKFSFQFTPTSDLLFYVSAAKGFRAGGVNPVLTSATIGQLIGQNGINPRDLPKVFDSDSVWSYEGGAKLGLFDRTVQLNASVYQIDWENIQTTRGVGGDVFISNVPTAQTQGAEFELVARPLDNLTLNAALAYMTGEYTSSKIFERGPGAAADLVIAREGEAFPLPEWTADIGARYDIILPGGDVLYARVDYRWSDSYVTIPSGTTGYSPDSSIVPQAENLNLRFGFERDAYEINLFVNNALDHQEGPKTGGRSQCANNSDPCTTFGSYQPFATTNWPSGPRRIGVQLAYRY
jgi:outer membrane receptor protein involved in Fe transport